MAPNVIEIEGLRKEYRRRTGRTVAVDGLDLAVPEGGVFGFLGPERLGQDHDHPLPARPRPPDGGRCGCSADRSRRVSPTSMRRVGAIVESPALFPTMSGRENLRLLGAIDRIGRAGRRGARAGRARRAGRRPGAEVLARHAPAARARRGAARRIPALLILDEPANGLDPAGIRSVRELLRRLGGEGRTVFVSSHLLAEIEQTCDRVAILSRGRCVTQGTVAEVERGGGPRRRHARRPSTTSTAASRCSTAPAPRRARQRPPARRGRRRPTRHGSAGRSASRATGSPSCAPRSAASKTCSSSSPTTRRHVRARGGWRDEPADGRDAAGAAPAGGAGADPARARRRARSPA